jgi:hypothetical protein
MIEVQTATHSSGGFLKKEESFDLGDGIEMFSEELFSYNEYRCR